MITPAYVDRIGQTRMHARVATAATTAGYRKSTYGNDVEDAHDCVWEEGVNGRESRVEEMRRDSKRLKIEIVEIAEMG